MLYLIEIMCRNNKINNNILMLTKGVRDRRVGALLLTNRSHHCIISTFTATK